MKKKIWLSSLLLAVGATYASAEERMTINEVMQSNINGVYVDNEFPDSWVELYYEGDRTFRMGGYRIGSSTNYDDAVMISGSTVARPNSFIMLYCDKTARTNHVDFRVDSGKGTLYLFNPQKEIIDQVTLKKQPSPNVAYGRVTEGSDTWGYEVTPTPGSANTGGVSASVLPDPVFQAESSTLFRNSRYRYITVTKPADAPADAVLCVTTNGAEPTINDKVSSGTYSKYTNSSLVLRAKLISPTMPSPISVSRSFLVHGRNFTIPVVSLLTNPEYMSDPTIGIFAGQNFLEDWRRPVYFEYFPTADGVPAISQLGEFRIHGGWTRNLAQKSMAFYANKRFGVKRFAYNFWKDRPNVSEYKSLILRNGGNNFSGARINDALTQTLFGRYVENLDWQAYQPVICYINGKYVGVYSLRERSNEDNIESNYEGLEDIDMVENWKELKAGTWDNYNSFVELYNSKPTYEQMCEAMDLENFTNTFILNSWSANTDYPGNNMVMWRDRAEGGKWRFLIKDQDFMAMNPSNKTYFSTILRTGSHAGDTDEGNRPEAVKLFQVMCSYPEYIKYFTDKFTVYLGDFLRSSISTSILEEMRDELSTEYPYHLNYYNTPITYDKWLSQLNSLKTWCSQRTYNLCDIMRDYFKLGEKVPVSINPHESVVRFNGTKLTQPNYIGYYYQDGTIELEGEKVNWKARITYTNGSVRTMTWLRNTASLEVTSSMTNIEFETIEPSPVTSITDTEMKDITITTFGDQVIAESTSAITCMQVVDLSGRTVASVANGDFTASVTLPQGFFIVTVKNESGKVYTQKVKI